MPALACGFGYSYTHYKSELNFQKEVYDNSRYKRINLFNVHQNLAFYIDPILEDYEKKKNIGKLRTELLSYAKGYILETAIGTSRNIKYYPEGSNILGTDWSSNMIEVALKKIIPNGIEIDYKMEDTEKMMFNDDVFDTVVDTFGLESYVNPEKALQEMKRVCKKGGRILILASGLSNNRFLNTFLKMKSPHVLRNYGYFPDREWDPIIKSMGLEIEKAERKFNGTIYLYVLKNNK